MDSIRNSRAQATRAQSTQAQATGVQATGVSATQQVPAANFTRHTVQADGDCLFRGLIMANNDQPLAHVTNADIVNLRQTAADYVTRNHQALAAHPSFGGDAGVNDLSLLLSTQGAWAGDAGNLAAPILARVLGREVRILNTAPQGGYYETNENRIYNPEDRTLPGAEHATTQPPIYLLHTNNGTHYDFLEARNSQAGATPETVTQPPTRQPDLTKLHEHFGIDDVDMITQENWTNDDWGKSVFMRLGDDDKTMCLSKDLLKHCFTDTKFGNATGGNSEGHGSELGAQRYVKLATSKGNIFLLTNRENQAAANRLEQHVSNSDNTSAAALSLEYQNKERIASVSTNERGQEFIMIGASMSHGQSEYPVYKLVNHQQKSIEQAEELASNGKSLFDDSGVDENLNRQHSSALLSPTAQAMADQIFAPEFIPRHPRPNNWSVGEPQQAPARMDNSREVARMPPESEYRPSGAQGMLAGRRNNQVISIGDRTLIRNAFTQEANGRDFGTLTREDQTTEVMRISRATGYIPSGVRAALSEINRQVYVPHEPAVAADGSHQQARTPRDWTSLTSGGNRQVQSQTARNEILNAFTEMANGRNFQSLNRYEQSLEVRRISQQTGFNPNGVQSTLNGEGNMPVRSRAARNQITNAFTQTANGPNFGALTQHQQDNEVRRISRQTGYNPTGVRMTLNGEGSMPVRSQAARDQITNAFTQSANNRTFRQLTSDQQSAEVNRISQETGYRRSGVRSTLNRL